MKRTFQPSNLVRKRKYGFRNRSDSVIAARRRKGRARIGI